jgi:hypothetical protein
MIPAEFFYLGITRPCWYFDKKLDFPWSLSIAVGKNTNNGDENNFSRTSKHITICDNIALSFILNLIPFCMQIQAIQNKIYEIRGQKVMLDFDLVEKN